MNKLLSTGIGLFTIWTGVCNLQLVNNVVPGLSQVTPVYSNITTTFMGREINNEWKFISHYEFVQIRNGRGQVGLPQVDSETLQDIQEDLDRELEEALETFEQEMDNLVEELTGESVEPTLQELRDEYCPQRQMTTTGYSMCLDQYGLN